MKTTKRTTLELGNSPLNMTVITRIVSDALIEYAPDWTLQRTWQWEIVIKGDVKYTDFQRLEEIIKTEIARLSHLYWDLETLGILQQEE